MAGSSQCSYHWLVKPQRTRALAAATEANNNLNLALTDAQRAYLFEVRGKAFLAQEDYPNAEFEFDQALGLVESGTGHYLKALALQAQGSIQKAVNELEWVLFWDSVFDYPFADDAAVRLDTLKGVLESGS